MENSVMEEIRQEVNNLKEQLKELPEIKRQLARLAILIKGKNIVESTTTPDANEAIMSEMPVDHQFQNLKVTVPLVHQDEISHGPLAQPIRRAMRIVADQKIHLKDQPIVREHIIQSIPEEVKLEQRKVLCTSKKRVVRTIIKKVRVLKKRTRAPCVPEKQDEDVAPERFEPVNRSPKNIEKVNQGHLLEDTKSNFAPGVFIPVAFEIPKFEKFEGITCPQRHLSTYIRKMARHITNDQMLLGVFQESLTGPALEWYLQLEKISINCWKDLMGLFLKQYQFNMRLKPKKDDLQRMKMKGSETLKQYAQRWEDRAKQVDPPLTDEEMVFTFLSILDHAFYEALSTQSFIKFSDLISACEGIEQRFKKGKFENQMCKMNGSESKKRKGVDMNANFPNAFQGTIEIPSRPQRLYQENDLQDNLQATEAPQASHSKKRKRRPYDPLPVTYTELLPQLLQRHFVSLTPYKPLKSPFPEWYDPNTRCGYHAGAVGHSTENCVMFKNKVRSLFKAGWLKFDQENKMLDLDNNTLAFHKGQKSK